MEVDHQDVAAAAVAVVAVLPVAAAASVDVAAASVDVAADAVVDGEFGLIPMQQLSQNILLSVPY